MCTHHTMVINQTVVCHAPLANIDHCIPDIFNKRRSIFMVDALFQFISVFSTHLENFLPFSSNLKLWSANSRSLEESKICCLEKD